MSKVREVTEGLALGWCYGAGIIMGVSALRDLIRRLA
jgi:hypothetical protein